MDKKKKQKGGNPKPKQGKGSKFERDVCKRLSLWWTDNKRDDIFWRTSGSGARAKTRSKKGDSTFGQYGDVQATDPIGQPLIDLCTIEIKKGYFKHSYFDLIDKLPSETKLPHIKFMNQVIADTHNAGTYSWLLITKRDRKETLIAMPSFFRKALRTAGSRLGLSVPAFNLHFYLETNRPLHRAFVITLTDFFWRVNPSHIKEVLATDFEAKDG